MLMIYVDDGILIGPQQSDLDEVHELLSHEFKHKEVTYPAFNMTDEGELADYLGVEIKELPNGTIKLSQPHLISQIIKDMGFKDNATKRDSPMASSVELGRDIDGEPYDEEWDHRSIIGKLNFLEKSTRCDLAYSVHVCARYASDPKKSHAEAVNHIVRYLVGTADKGIILNPKGYSFDCFVDADFANFDKATAEHDPGTAKSRTGYLVLYGGCPMVWASKLQKETALSTTEAEYGALSESLKDVLFLMQLLDKAKTALHWTVYDKAPIVHCKAFQDNTGDLAHCRVMEDNSGAYEMARLPKMRPRMLNIRYYW